MVASRRLKISTLNAQVSSYQLVTACKVAYFVFPHKERFISLQATTSDIKTKPFRRNISTLLGKKIFQRTFLRFQKDDCFLKHNLRSLENKAPYSNRKKLLCFFLCRWGNITTQQSPFFQLLSQLVKWPSTEYLRDYVVANRQQSAVAHLVGAHASPNIYRDEFGIRPQLFASFEEYQPQFRHYSFTAA